MKRSDAVKKYGKKMFKEMEKHLDGITIKITGGEVDIPESDLRLAYRMVKGEKIGPFEWD